MQTVSDNYVADDLGSAEQIDQSMKQQMFTGYIESSDEDGNAQYEEIKDEDIMAVDEAMVSPH